MTKPFSDEPYAEPSEESLRAIARPAEMTPIAAEMERIARLGAYRNEAAKEVYTASFEEIAKTVEQLNAETSLTWDQIAKWPIKPFAGLSKLIDEVTEEGPELPVDAWQEVLPRRGGFEALARSLEIGAKYGTLNGQRLDLTVMFGARAPSLCEPISYNPETRLLVVKPLEWAKKQGPLSKRDMLELLEMPTLDELTPVEPLSEAISVYCTGPLKPGERHEARVVASKGRLTVHGVLSQWSIAYSARDPKTGHAVSLGLCNSSTKDAVHLMTGRDEDVIVEIVVVAP